MSRRPLPPRRGFTLVEVLIVVVILGILAATVLPQFANSTGGAKEAALRQNLQQVRGQIELYRFQHDGTLPGDAGSEADFLDDMLLTTDAVGVTDGDRGTGSIGTKPYGPYLLGQFPPNPFNGRNGIALSETNPADGTTGWWYNPATGEFRANLPDSELAEDGTTPLNGF